MPLLDKVDKASINIYKAGLIEMPSLPFEQF